jgi:protein-tyrosine phosphatase
MEDGINIIEGELLKNDVSNSLVYVSKDETIDNICDNLFLSGYLPATNKNLLNKYNIKYILTAAKDLPPVFPDDFCYKVIPLYDSEYTKINKFFNESFEFIESAKSSNILIHCGAGISRSASIIIAYLIYNKKIPYSEALKIVKAKRLYIRPNIGFEKILRNYSYEVTKEF